MRHSIYKYIFACIKSISWMPTIITIVVSLTCVTSSAENSTQVNKPDSYTWQTRSANEKIYSTEISNLYLTLYNADLLPVTKVKNTGELFPEKILRKNNLLFGRSFPITLDSLMCDLNPHVCERKLVSTEPDKKGDFKTTIDGYQISESKWTMRKGDTITVPDISFSETVKFVPYRKTKSENIENILSKRKANCSEYSGIPCDAAVSLFNPAHMLTDGFEGTVILPEKVYQTKIYSQKLESKSYPKKDSSRNIPNTSSRDAYERNINEHLSSRGGGKLFSSMWSLEPAFPKQEELYSLISHPAMFHSEVPNGEPIVVFDSFVDQNHCDLIKGNIIVNNLSTRTSNTPHSCGSDDNNPSTINHGTHVTSILAADLDSEGMGGISPMSKIFTHEVIESKLANEGNETHRSYIASVIKDNFFDESKRASTYNFSLGYTNVLGGNDKIAEAIQALKYSALFVAAAGNESNNFDNAGCSLLPACLQDLENVITVVALDRNEDSPSLWKTDSGTGSNFSKNFHIGAIGENVLGATELNQVGFLSGTSQAAPQVSGAASMIWTSLRSNFPGELVLPVHVKFRLIYSSDMFPSLNGKIFGGRLNIDRAIDAGVSRIKLKGQPTPIRGLVTKTFSRLNDGDKNQNWVFFKNTSGNDESIKVKDIKRLIFNPTNLRFTAFTIKKKNNGGIELVKLENLKSISPSFHFEIDTGASTKMVKLGDIFDYTAPFIF